jgi:mannose-1-phosphate guanylyltransferase
VGQVTAAEAILLVGGQGSRLRPLTANIPKPMLPCAGVPLLTHQIVRLREAGVRHVILATSYRPEVFTDYFGDGTALGLALEYMTETEPLGTGGGIRNAAALLGPDPEAPVLVLNGDVLSGHDIGAQLAVHAAACAEVTLHLVRVPDPRAFGCVPTNAEGRVTAFLEKSPEPVSDQINAGCYVFRRGTIDTIPDGDVVSVERDTFPGLLSGGSVVAGYVDCSYWLDLGTPAAFVQGSADLVRGVLRSVAVERPGSALVAPDASVAVDAVIDGGSAIGPGAVVGAGARVSGSVLLAGAQIAAGAVVRDSVVGLEAYVGERTALFGAVVGDAARIGADNELIAGARVWTDAVIGDHAVRFSAPS